MARSYESIVLARIKALFARKPKPDKSDFDAEIATAIRAAGGYAKAERARTPAAAELADRDPEDEEPEDDFEDEDTGSEEAELADVELIYQTPGASCSMGNGKEPPDFVKKMPANKRKQWVNIWNSAYERCQKSGGSNCDQSAFKQANGVVKASEPVALALPQQSAIYKKTMRDCLKAGGSMASCVAKAKQADAAGSVKASEWGESDGAGSADASRFYTMARLRLADTATALPEWQQLHKIGEWSIAHGVSGKIRLTREMGNSMIANFHTGVVRKPIVLNEEHLRTPALAEMADVRWGNKYEGLPGVLEPAGVGDILYVRWDYTDIGRQKLVNRHYHNQSPEYDLDYVDKESGNAYGPTIVGCAATNDPYLRLRTWQGQEAPEPVLLIDGSERPQGATAMAEATANGSAEASVQLADQIKAYEVRLAEAEKRSAENERLLLAEREQRHKDGVTAYVRELEGAHMPPAVIRLTEQLLLGNSPDGAGVIRLSDAADAATLNTYAGVKALLAEFRSLLNAGLITLSQDNRPDNTQAVDERQRQGTRELMAGAGIAVTANGTNGSHA